MRFGRTSNITAVVLGDEPADEYFKGVLISAIVLFVIFLLWMVTLLVLKCCFRRRAGVFSGTPVHFPHTSTSSSGGGGGFPQTNQDMGPETTAENENENRLEPTEEVVESKVPEGFSKTNEGPTEIMAPNDNVSEDVKGQAEESQGPDFVETKKVTLDVAEARMKAYQKTLCLRFMVLLGVYGVMVGSILMITKGIVNVEDAADSGRKGLQEGARLSLGAADLIRKYTDAQKPVVEQMQAVIQEFNGFCPQVRQNICEVNPLSFEVTKNCNFTDIPFGDLLSRIDLPRLDTAVVFEELDDGEEDLRKLAADLQEQDEAIDDIEWPFKVARAFALILFILSFGVLICLAYVWRQDYLKIKSSEKHKVWNKKSRQGRILVCLKSWLLLPTFVLFVVLSLVFSTVFVVLSTTTSDVCVDGPDGTILAYLRENEDNLDGIIFKFVEFYVSRCPPEAFSQEFDFQVDSVSGIFDNIANFLASVEDSRDDVAAICGPDPNPIVETANILLTQLCIIRELIIDIGVYFSCENCK
jgi:hypothetical protein